jgi:hypothetical protein
MTLEDLQRNPAQQTEQTSPDGTAEDSTGITQPEEVFGFKSAITKLIEVIHWSVAVLEITLLIRFFFKLLGADQGNPFVGFLYALTDVILIVFSTIFRPVTINRSNILEWSTLVGMLIIWLIYLAIRWLLRIVISEPQEETS